MTSHFSISADKIRKTSATSPMEGESPIDFVVRRRLEIRSWFVGGADFATIADAYDLSIKQVKGIIVGDTSKRLASASIQATPEQIDAKPITKDEALMERPILIEPNKRVTPEVSFARAHQIYRWRRAGLPMTVIANRLGIGAERASQIMFSHGFPRIFRHGWRSEVNGVSRKEDGSVTT